MSTTPKKKNANDRVPPPLTMAYFRTARCMTPGCTADHSDDGLFMHQMCHMKQGVYLQLEDRILSLTCAVCFRPIVRIAVNEDQFPNLKVGYDGFIKNSCHRYMPVWVYVQKGVVRVFCAKCESACDEKDELKNDIDKLTVAEEESAIHERRATTPA